MDTKQRDFGSLKIHLWPNDILLKESKDVIQFNNELIKIFHEMANLMMEAEGIGLAAPQVGISQRFFIMVTSKDECHDGVDLKNLKLEFIANPRIIQFGSEKTIFEEGCLSLPKRIVQVERYKSLTAEYFNEKGKKKIRSFTNLEAICFQHENDHLEGLTILDKLAMIANRAEIEMAKKTMMKQKKRLIAKFGHLYK